MHNTGRNFHVPKQSSDMIIGRHAKLTILLMNDGRLQCLNLADDFFTAPYCPLVTNKLGYPLNDVLF